eukprot:CAMPEP_0177675114 /NCGR_PEP_ID=MMETSP0447-20121125/26991_1 /TAXON_ID=0 /ORGANISM="Stygamoeba regulata, Strain BSH-02190019" /LENGTH=1814 /DNA_ID=CAMNT_0019183405 /DNA_START=127 /DNA_END=5571 /DNA_ORIENTATION=+
MGMSMLLWRVVVLCVILTAAQARELDLKARAKIESVTYAVKEGIVLGERLVFADVLTRFSEPMYVPEYARCMGTCQAKEFNCTTAACDYSDPDACGTGECGCNDPVAKAAWCSVPGGWTRLEVGTTERRTIALSEVHEYRFFVSDACRGFRVWVEMFSGSATPKLNNQPPLQTSSEDIRLSVPYKAYPPFTVCPNDWNFAVGTYHLSVVPATDTADYRVHFEEFSIEDHGLNITVFDTPGRTLQSCVNSTRAIGEPKCNRHTLLREGGLQVSQSYIWDMLEYTTTECEELNIVFNLNTRRFIPVPVVVYTVRDAAENFTFWGYTPVLWHREFGLYGETVKVEVCGSEDNPKSLYIGFPPHADIVLTTALDPNIRVMRQPSLSDLAKNPYGNQAHLFGASHLTCPGDGDRTEFECRRGTYIFENTHQCIEYFPVLQNPFVPVPVLLLRADDKFKAVNIDFSALPGLSGDGDPRVLRSVFLLEFRDQTIVPNWQSRLERCEVRFESTSPLVNKAGTASVARVPWKRRDIKCDQERFAQITKQIDELQAELDKNTAFAQANSIRFTADILAFDDAWIGCRQPISDLMTRSDGALEIETAACVEPPGSKAFEDDPCCNPRLAWESQCCREVVKTIASPELEANSGVISDTCSGDNVCVDSYLADYMFYERFGSEVCNSIIGDTAPIIKRSVSFYHECREKVIGSDFGGRQCFADSDCPYSDCDLIERRCLWSDKLMSAFWDCLDRDMPQQVRALLSRSLDVNEHDVTSELRSQAKGRDCMTAHGPDLQAHRRFERTPFGKPAELCTSSTGVPGAVSCLDTSCPVPLRFESQRRRGRDESACDYRWTVETRAECGATVCNTAAALSGLACATASVCAVCESPTNCVTLPGNFTREECEAKFACFQVDGSMTVVDSKEECDALESCANKCYLEGPDYSTDPVPELNKVYKYREQARNPITIDFKYLNWTDGSTTLPDTVEITLAGPAYNYIAIGIGGLAMYDLDVVTCWVDDDGGAHCEDRLSERHEQPREDTELGGRNDIVVVSGTRKDGITSVTFQRKLNTGDPLDHVITPTMGNFVVVNPPTRLGKQQPGLISFHFSNVLIEYKGIDWAGGDRPPFTRRTTCTTREQCEQNGGTCEDRKIPQYINTVRRHALRVISRVCVSPLNPFNGPDCKTDVHSLGGDAPWAFGCVRTVYSDEECTQSGGRLYVISDGRKSTCGVGKMCKEPDVLSEMLTDKDEKDCKECGGEFVDTLHWEKGLWGGGVARRFGLVEQALVARSEEADTVDWVRLFSLISQAALDTVVHQYKSQLQCGYNPRKQLLGELLCRCTNDSTLCNSASTSVSLATATVCPSIADRVVAPPFVLSLEQSSVKSRDCIDFQVALLYSSEFGNTESSRLGTTFRAVAEYVALEAVRNSNDAVVGSLIGNAIKITSSQDVSQVTNVHVCFFLENSIPVVSVDYTTLDFATQSPTDDNLLVPLGISLEQKGQSVCGVLKSFDMLRSGVLAPIARLYDYENKSDGSSLETYELIIFIIVAVVFGIIMAIALVKQALSLWWRAYLHNQVMNILILAAAALRMVYFVLLAAEVFDVADETVIQVIIVELPTFLYMDAYVIMIMLLLHLLLGYFRKSIRRGMFVWVPFILVTLLLIALLVVVVVLFETSNGTTNISVECGPRTIITGTETDSRPQTLRIVYKSILVGIACLLAILLICCMSYLWIISNKMKRKRSTENQLMLSVSICGVGLIANCIAFIVYYVVDQPTAWFALVLLPTEALPWLTLLKQLKMHTQAGNSGTFPSSQHGSFTGGGGTRSATATSGSQS